MKNRIFSLNDLNNEQLINKFLRKLFPVKKEIGNGNPGVEDGDSFYTLKLQNIEDPLYFNAFLHKTIETVKGDNCLRIFSIKFNDCLSDGFIEIGILENNLDKKQYKHTVLKNETCLKYNYRNSNSRNPL